MLQRFISIGLIRKLGTALFPSGNWHQSFSGRVFDPTTRDRDALLRVGDRISAHACTLLFNRIEGPDLATAKQHCTLRAYGNPKAFQELLASIQRSLTDAGFGQIATGVTPHITLSYRATSPFDNIPLTPAIKLGQQWPAPDNLVAIGIPATNHQAQGIDPPATQSSLF
ncbi:hypothetical protein [Pseudoxanthomonas sp. SE1]|uniref:hypothetical protein n=1 Tax=Pseudoxanthomonas sp. SE1 TaxID=1664560 RepID=UPI00240E706A|nr:hypothetical protein [Pseudoxanthomonas sp. SE1]WFC41986.1 hypothetical protein OY559_00120 [Pseudoxanthomonas sp. SE1]